MNITSVSALSGGYNFAALPYMPPATSTRSTTQLASGATVTTIRGSTGDIVAVSTAVTASASPATQNRLGETGNSTFYVTA